ncbi:hypothetical protein ACY2C7_10240 [Staphylococcus cohnii]|uniref:Uncharacterized protein n=1 Tax=Staphylococcus cohnii TaxID=29382 RepID=A0A2T4LVY4_9STAP|nr:hypothetical protein [Staphylococcus cohnii]PTF09295.1 hypothetical protein BUY36_00840 [Staphylococcus cohnii]PTF67697.1 hypothetical protein BUY34_00390 [Staphylococcus cohnii]PTG67352.1 hypothetical protein BUY28_04790 [Staphylococcus cohnii]RIM32535.1 hypothetical protein BUY35_01165 [Staphylococcus cohnii]
MKQNAELKSIVIAIIFAAAADVVPDGIFHKILLLMGILAFIYRLITQLKFTLYHIKIEDNQQQTWFSVKMDYWLLFIKNMVAISLLLAIYCVSVYVDNHMAWIIIPLLIVGFIGLILFENKMEKKSNILESENVEE